MLDQQEINPFSGALVMWGPEYQILRRRAFKEDETKPGRVLILFREGGGDFIERQWLLSAAQCVLISPTMHSPSPHCAPQKPSHALNFKQNISRL